MKTIVAFSGGKDSAACLIWAKMNFTEKLTAVFCDTNWESQITYDYINDVAKKLGVELIVLKSKKYDGFIDMVKKKKRFPSSKRRFCTEELKSIPMVNYLLSLNDDFIVIQGIRKSESFSRSLMKSECNYFKYYKEPFKIDKNGKPKYYTHRRKEVLKYMEQYATDVLRPVFDWSGQDVIDYAVENSIDPNPLYSMGMKRVGCFPCIMAGLFEIYQIAMRFPERIDEIEKHEKEIGSTFFPYDKIPKWFTKHKKPSIRDVVAYAKMEYEQGRLFGEPEPTSCMSYYGLCE